MDPGAPALGTAADPGAPAGRGARRWLVLAVLCVSLLIVSLDGTILNIALPTLVRDLHATESQLQWIADIYSCVFAGVLLLGGTLGDRLGRRRIFAVGLVVFGCGSAASAFSHAVTPLVVARGVMGLGAACIMPATLSIITDVFREPDVQRKAIGIWSGTSGLGIALGPIVGGWLLAHFWWGSVFLVNVPVAALGLAAALWLVPESSDPARRPVDVPGAVLSTAGLGLLLWSIIEIPVDGWHSVPVVAAGATAVVLLASFVLWERHTTHPMLLLEAFRDRRFSVAMVTVAMAVFALMGAMFILTQYLQFVLGYSALAAGVRIVPISALLAVASLSSTGLDRWLGTKVVVASGLLLVAGGLWQMAGTTRQEGFTHALVGMCLLGFGAGFILAPATASVMGSLPRQRAGVGSATNSAALQVGGALGVAVLGSVVASRYQAAMIPLLHGRTVPGSVRDTILGSIGGAQAVAHAVGGALGAALSATAGRAFVSGMDAALTVGAVVVGVSVIVALVALPSRRAAGPVRLVTAVAAGPTGPTGPAGPAGPVPGDAGRQSGSAPRASARWCRRGQARASPWGPPRGP